ncbi:F-box/WD repeat-containing protein 9-like [Neocloeon triangulifer]|uniref:F-box/WD repeat-containing protein 9-like n=1 Tax=Neocloeon triangulifer TaxID=2078957 RepID=UPI00286F590C|nr:F-box/WD repeat-containing protein 9-like [Neocloeon triangulifer]
MENQTDYLSKLPIEIFLYICSFLDVKKSLPALKCTCKRLNEILCDELVWKSRVAGRWLPNEKETEVDWKEACTCVEIEASYLREPTTCDQIVFRKAHESDIDALHILENHQILFTGSRDGFIKIWNINKEKKTLEKSMILPGAHNGWVWRIASESSRQIFSCSFDHSMKHWNFNEDKLTEIWNLDLKKPVMSLIVVDENLIAAGLHSEVALVDRRQGTAIRHIFKDNFVKLNLALINKNILVSNGVGKKICLYDLRYDKEAFCLFDFSKEKPVVPMHLAVQQNILYVSDNKSKLYACDVTKEEPFLIKEYYPPEGERMKVIGMFASYTSLIMGLNYNKSGHIAFWRPRASATSEDERYPALRKVGEFHNIGDFNGLCSQMHHRDGMIVSASIAENDLVCVVPKDF